jgi:hypothetical protein
VKPLLLALISLLTIGGPGGAARNWQTLAASRPRGTVDSLRVIVRYDAGRISVGPAAAPLLYDARARYDADEQRLSRRYDAVTHTLHVGVDSALHASARVEGDSREQQGRLDLGLATGVPLDLDLDLGATRAVLDLGSLWVDALHVSSGATETDVTFGTANPQPMRDLFVDAGVGSITIHGLGNARAEHASIASTVGSVDIDFGGAWTGELPVTLRVALCSATLRVPRDAGIALRLSRRLANVDSDGFSVRDGVYYSNGYEQAKRHIVVDGSATLASVDLIWNE